MATTLRDPARRLLRAALLAGLASGSVACACPPRVDSYATPAATLATWQSRLCRDAVQDEYACLAASFQRRMGGFPTYHAARAALLERNATAAWLFGRADLEQHIVRTQYTQDGLEAFLELEALGETLSVAFERETWLTVGWADGSTESRRQELPLARLLGSQSGRQWLDIQRPELPADRLDQVRCLSVDLRWKIKDIAGLAADGARRSGADVLP